MTQPLNIAATATLEIDGKEYAATVSATVYPAREQTRDYPGDEQEIEIEDVFIDGLQQWRIILELDKPNYDRCLTAVNQKLESLLENQ